MRLVLVRGAPTTAISCGLVVNLLRGTRRLAPWEARSVMYQRKRYPPNWPALSRACKELAGWKCQHCHVPQGRRRKSRHSRRWYRVHLHAAHLDHDPENEWPRLAALCERCHGRYDWAWRVRCLAVDLERLKHKILVKRKARQY